MLAERVRENVNICTEDVMGGREVFLIQACTVVVISYCTTQEDGTS